MISNWEVQWFYVIGLFNFLGFSTIAAKIKGLDLGHSNILDYCSQKCNLL